MKEFDPGRRKFIERSVMAAGGVILDRHLPDPITIIDLKPEWKFEPINEQAHQEQKRVMTELAIHPVLKKTYRRAVLETQTTIPWSVLAGVHYREADMVRTLDLQSGEPLGDRSLLGSVKQLVKELREKVDGRNPRDPKDFSELVKALSLYNGPGNRNYDRSPYPHIPKFIGEDHNYVMNWFDERHKKMYKIYCEDGERCPTGTRDTKAGALTVASWFEPEVFREGLYQIV